MVCLIAPSRAVVIPCLPCLLYESGCGHSIHGNEAEYDTLLALLPSRLVAEVVVADLLYIVLAA